MTGPSHDEPHVQEGVCICIHVGTTRVPVVNCGLSTHRIQAAADAQIRRDRRG